MATIAQDTIDGRIVQDHLSGTPRAHALDRWIFVINAAFFVLITLTGFIPDSLMKIDMVNAGQRPPFPTILHVHAVLMGSFLLLLLAQTILMATGRNALHRRIGPAAMVLVPALVVAGIVLVPTTWLSIWGALQHASPEARPALQDLHLRLDDIMLLQLRIGILFPLLIWLGLRARNIDAGLHKRLMLLAPAVALPAAFDRITWLPTTFPHSPVGPDLYVLLAIAPMFLWDFFRNRRVHHAYVLFLAVSLPLTVFVHAVWDTPWWHNMAHRLMGV